jgi:5-methylthioadenosine/S-adenosylhomocysteine deaminase
MQSEKPILFRSIAVLTPDMSDGVSYLERGFVSVSGDRILYSGADADLAAASFGPLAYDTYEGSGRMILPAFANAHAHTAMVLMRNAADDRNLQDWLFQMIFPMEERLRREDVFNGSLLGIAQMIRGGIGACADMYYYADATLEAAAATGFRMNLCCEGKGADPANGSMRVLPERVSAFQRDCLAAGNGRILPSLMIHSVYLYESGLYPELADMARNAGIPIHTHLSETKKEVGDCLEKYGRSPVIQLAEFGVFDGPCLAAHAVHLSEEDLEILAAHPVTIVHNPSSNMKLGSGMADVPAMIRHGIPVALGTDGAASNNALDLYHEMRLAAFIAKCRAFDASVLPAARVFRMATVDGMRGMGFGESGVVASGMKADLQILDTRDVSLCPLGDPVSAMVYSAGTGTVESLMVDGHMLMRKRELLTIDEERVLFEANRSAAHVTGR